MDSGLQPETKYTSISF